MNEVKYKGVIDLSVKNNSHTIAYEMIERFSNGQILEILEVGCSSGYFGSALKSAGHVVWGIEPNKDSAKLAAKKLDYVYEGLVEGFIIAFPKKKFDVICFGDVIEHIAYPEEILNNCHKLLVEGGAIVASVPNVAHIYVRSMLLEGRWEYSELGTLDKTHLRFFTRNTIQELFIDCDFSVVEIKAVRLTGQAAANISNTALNETVLNNVEKLATDDNLFDFQYVLTAIPVNSKVGHGSKLLSERPRTKVLALSINIDNSHFNVRLGEPLRTWADIYGGDLICKSFENCEKSDLAWADVLVIQRHLDVKVMDVIFIAQNMGKKIIFEIDDLMINLPDFLSHHNAGLIGYEAALNAVVKQVNCITVTTKRLKQQLQRYSIPTIVIPNAVSDNKLHAINTESWIDGKATLVFASSDSILLTFMLPAISHLMKSQNIQLKLIVIGPNEDAFNRFEIKFEHHPILSYDEFRKFIRTIDNPIGIIPLDNSLFSSCKSPVKYFDYSLAGIPVICSDVPPYNDVITNGVNGLLVSENSVENWIQAIEELVNSVTKRKELLRHSTDLVNNEYNLAKSAINWNRLLSKLMCNVFDKKHLTKPSRFRIRYNKLVYIVSHLFRVSSYKGAIRVLKRDGIEGLISRVFSTKL